MGARRIGLPEEGEALRAEEEPAPVQADERQPRRITPGPPERGQRRRANRSDLAQAASTLFGTPPSAARQPSYGLIWSSRSQTTAGIRRSVERGDRKKSCAETFRATRALYPSDFRWVTPAID